MCRRQHLTGCMMLGFGLGLLIGQCFDSGFLCLCGGIVFITFGLCGMRKK